MQLILRLSVVTDMVVMVKTDKMKQREREGNKEERDTRNIFSFPYKIGLEL